jgi:hypothetical protein
MPKVCVTIARIERADPCHYDYGEFLARVRGPHPSKAYVARRLAVWSGDKATQEAVREQLARLCRRKAFRIGRHDPIPLSRIAAMSRMWIGWVERNVLTPAQIDAWSVEQGIVDPEPMLIVERDDHDYDDYLDHQDEEEFDAYSEY